MSEEESVNELKRQLQVKDEELRAMKTSFDEYVESSKELEMELEGALDDAENRYKTLSAKKIKLDQSVGEMSTKIADQTKSLVRVQEALAKSNEEVTRITQQKRELEQRSEDASEKLRQAEFSVEHSNEKLEEAEEAYAMLQCELDELRTQKEESEKRLKAELTELQAEVAQYENVVASDSTTNDSKDIIDTLKVELSQKESEMKTMELKFEEVEKKLRSELAEACASAMIPSTDSTKAELEKEVKTLRDNLALVQTELAQVQTEASQTHAMQQTALANFKSSVFSEQEELNGIILELSKKNDTLQSKVDQLKSECRQKDEIVREMRSKQGSAPSIASDMSLAGDSYRNESECSNAVLSDIHHLGQLCWSSLQDVLKDSKSLLERKNGLAVTYNCSDSEATMLSVKLSQLKDQFEDLTQQHELLKQNVKNDTVTLHAEQNNEKLQSDMSSLTEQKNKIEAAMLEQTSHLKELKAENEELRAEMQQLADRVEAQRKVLERNGSEGVEKIKTLEAQVKLLEENVMEEKSAKDAAEQAVDDLSNKLKSSEDAKESLQKKIRDFVSLGDMREVGWQAEREELTKSIRQMTQDIEFLRQNEKRISKEAIAANGAKRVSLEDNHDGVMNGESSMTKDIIDSTSRSRLAAERAIKSGDVKQLRDELRHQVYRYEQLREHNAKLLQKVQKCSNSIQVGCRLRPPSEQELAQGSDICMDVVDDSHICLYDKRIAMWKSFEFDKVWDEDAKQVDVFADVEPLALSAVDGYNACIFAYGMTGSGKTYTMTGYGDDYGVSYRVVHKIFELLTMKRVAVEKGVELRKELAKGHGRTRLGRKMSASPFESSSFDLQKNDSNDNYSDPESPGKSVNSEPTFNKDATYTKQSFNFTVSVSMMEIYNESVKDLLCSGESSRGNATNGLDIRQDSDGNVNVPGLVSEDVHCLEDVMSVLDKGSANRATSATNINEHSSRSHCIMMINVTTVSNGGIPVLGKLCLVDLAGSEKIERSGAQGRQLKEAQHINRSLSALGDVLEALENKAKHIPYRNSKLTYLLQDCLGGNSRTMMIVTVCPTELTMDESLFCLQFASRARNIQIDASKRNVSWKTIEESLKQAKSELKEEKKKVTSSAETIKELKLELKTAKEKVSSQMGFKLKNLDESRKSSELQVQVLSRTNSELMLRLQEEKEQVKQMCLDMEGSQKALRRAQEQLKHCKAERDRILATQSYKEQENHNLREMLRIYEDGEEFVMQQENHRQNGLRGKLSSSGSGSGSRLKGSPEGSSFARRSSRHNTSAVMSNSFSASSEAIPVHRQPSPGRRGRSVERDMHNSISYDADGKDKRRSTGNTSRNTSLGPITRAQEALEKHQERMRKKRKEKEAMPTF